MRSRRPATDGMGRSRFRLGLLLLPVSMFGAVLGAGVVSLGVLCARSPVPLLQFVERYRDELEYMFDQEILDLGFWGTLLSVPAMGIVWIGLVIMGTWSISHVRIQFWSSAYFGGFSALAFAVGEVLAFPEVMWGYEMLGAILVATFFPCIAALGILAWIRGEACRRECGAEAPPVSGPGGEP